MNIRIIYAAIMAVTLVACANQQAPRYSGASFLPPARDVSSAFLRPGGDVYLVPEKGVIVEDVRGINGQPLDWRTDGSYVILPAQSIQGANAVDLVIFGKLRRQSTSPQRPQQR